jgi:hypothetical protein
LKRVIDPIARYVQGSALVTNAKYVSGIINIVDMTSENATPLNLFIPSKMPVKVPKYALNPNSKVDRMIRVNAKRNPYSPAGNRKNKKSRAFRNPTQNSHPLQPRISLVSSTRLTLDPEDKKRSGGFLE